MLPYFIDTFWIHAVLNPHDAYHALAMDWARRLRTARLVTTEAVLTEVGNTFSKKNRVEVADYLATFYVTPRITILPITPNLFQRGLALYRARPDKEWGLTDCLSFVVMQDQNIVQALTGDRHFEQAGFEAVLLRD